MKRWMYGAGGLAAGLALAFGFAGPEHTKYAAAQSASNRSAADLAAEAAGPQRASLAPANGLALGLSYAPVVKRVAPAIVNVYTARTVNQRPTMSDFYRYMFGQGAPPRPRVERSLGSGVIVRADGLIITNNHVIAGANEIVVALADRREYPAKLVFADEKSDLAALRIDAGGVRLPTARLGDSDRAEVGDVVLAIGDPFGIGQTVTQGIVSATARTNLGISDTGFFLQTDAAINPGNSGGALVSATGEVIGINSSIISGSGGSQGVGFAIPSNMVRQFIAASATGHFVRAWIGASGDTVTTETAAAAGLDRPTGVLLTQVSPGSPASAAGLRVGDIVYAIDGKDVPDAGALGYRIATQEVGSPATLTIVRDRRARNVAIRLTAPPEMPPRQTTQLGPESILNGVTIANLSPALAQELGAGAPDRGVIVMGVAPGAPLARVGTLAPGDILETVNGRPVATVAEVRRGVAVNGGPLQFRFNRAGQHAECAFQPPAQFGCRS